MRGLHGLAGFGQGRDQSLKGDGFLGGTGYDLGLSEEPDRSFAALPASHSRALLRTR